jgi:enoyl-CoA hydratase/carnithine racemase
MPVTLTVEDNGVAHLTLDRPRKRNALDHQMLLDLRTRVSEISARDDIRVVVVRGGGGTFCAGADIADWVAPTHDVASRLSQLGQDTFAELAALPVLTVDVIEGTAVGGGLELAVACDVRITTTDAIWGLPELGLGNLPSWGGTARLVDIAGLGVTRRLLLTSELITGSRAVELHIATSAHAPDQLEEAAQTVLDRALAAEPTAVGLAKKLLADFEHSTGLEAALAAYTAGLDSSRQRKQDFLDRKAAARAARSTTPTQDADLASSVISSPASSTEGLTR